VRFRSRRSRPLEQKPIPPEDAPRLAYATALRLLARRARTQAEIRAGLARRGFESGVADDTIARLERAGLIDDAAVADAVVRDAGRRLLGSRRVAVQLAKRGVPKELRGAAVAASGAADVEAARELLRRRFPGGPPADRRAAARALRTLVARGFTSSVARRALGIDFDVDSDAREHEPGED
jgi:regulatory protein